jgi:tRNA nucleotidyltransferase (CCA-adding enzyme)
MPRIDTNALEGDLLLRGVWEGLGTPECHLTGGYVRDRLLGRRSVDLDLVLPGTLETAAGPARRLAARLDTRAHVLGRDANRVWRIETPKIKIELWPLGDLSLDQDIQRRDFTCNALVWRLPDGPLDDRVSGVADLGGRVIRALSRENLEDDPVRLVRAPRFLAQLEGFEIEPQSSRWIHELAPACVNAPRERIGQELLKLLGAPTVATGIRALMDLGLFEPAAPVAARCDRQWLEGHLEAASRLSGSAAHPVTAAAREAGIAGHLALLLRGWGRPAVDAVAAYAWPRTARRSAARAAVLLEDVLAVVEAPAPDRRSLIHSAGASFPAALALAAAVEPDRPWARWWRLWRERGPELTNPEPLLSGEEVGVILGVAPGPELGHAIDALSDAQVRGIVRTASGAERWLRRTFER